MPIDNANAKIVKFSEDYEFFSQQMESRVASIVKQKTFTGEFYIDDYINSIESSDVIVNRVTGAATVDKDLGFGRRQLAAQTLTWSTYKAEKDVAEMFKDPTSETVKVMVSVMNRKRDNITVTAMIGNVPVFNGSTYDVSGLPAAQVVPALSTGLTVEKLIQTKVLMDDAEIDEEGRCIVASSSVLAGLLRETKFTSADYNTIKTLVAGNLQDNKFMGFEFIKAATKVTGLTTEAIAFQKDKVLFGENLSRKIRIAEDPAHNYDWVIHIEEQVGAIRREDAGVVKIENV